MIKSAMGLAIIILLFACNGSVQKEQAPDNTLQHNETLVRQYFNEVWNQGDTALLDSLLASDYINHTPSIPEAGTGIAGLKTILMAIRKGYPDLHYEIQDMIVTNDRVVARVVMTGTQSDSLFSIPPTGKKIQVNQINIEQISNGRISQHWRVTDELTMMKQLGVVQ